LSRIQIRVQGTLVSGLRVEGDSHSGYHLFIQDPLFGKFPIGDLKLEIFPEGRFGWVEVTEHELLALLLAKQ
jgi:hypothetical protein